MSRERAQRRVARERESALRTAAVAAQREREEHRLARRRAVASRLPHRAGRPTGILAERRRTRFRLLVAALVLAQVLIWLFRHDWASRLGALAVSLLLFPLLVAFTV